MSDPTTEVLRGTKFMEAGSRRRVPEAEVGVGSLGFMGTEFRFEKVRKCWSSMLLNRTLKKTVKMVNSMPRYIYIYHNILRS